MDLFREPWMLAWLAAFLAGAAALQGWASRRRARLAAAFARPETLPRLSAPEAEGRRRLKFLLQAAGVSLGLLALAGPQWGVELVTSEALGTQTFVAVDTSLSMLVEDVEPSRIGKARNELSQLLDGLQGQRVGVIAFAGEAGVQCPLTTDIAAAKSFLAAIAPGMIPRAGTSLGKAIDTAARALARYPGHKAVVLLTDGEDRVGGAIESARAAAAAGVHIYIIGVGTPEGGPIPLRDAQGAITGYKKDRSGNTVVSKLGEDGLMRVAAASGGAYYRATPQENEAAAIVQHIGELERSRIQAGSANVFKNRYRVPLALAFLLLLAELLVPEMGRERRASGGAPPAQYRDRRAAGPASALRAVALAALVPALSACGEKAAFDLWRGNRSYRRDDFSNALQRYETMGRGRPSDARPAFNAGDAQYKLGRFDEAKEQFAKLTDPAAVPRGVAPKAWYNLGNSHYKKGEYQDAVEAYKRCLLLDPDEEDCRFNLVKALQAVKQPPKKDDKKDPRQDPKKDSKDDRQEPKPRPQSGMSREDAERILQAVQEREKGAARRQPVQKKGAKPPPPEEADW